MKFLLVFVVGSIFFFPGLQAFSVNGNPKDDMLGTFMQEQMGKRQSSYQVVICCPSVKYKDLVSLRNLLPHAWITKC